MSLTSGSMIYRFNLVLCGSLAVALVSLTVNLAAGFAGEIVPKLQEEIQPIKTWTGTCRSGTLRNAAPEDSLITDSESWKELWKLWQTEAAVPEIDFEIDFIVVKTGLGPNGLSIGKCSLSKGNLTLNIGTTLVGGPGFGYLLMQFPRAGFETVDQVKILSAKESAKRRQSRANITEKAASFETLEIETTGGFAGLMQVEQISTDGKIIVKSIGNDQTLSERQLSDDLVKLLHQHVAKTDWSRIPANGNDGSHISDGMHHVVRIKIATGQSYEFRYGGLMIRNVAQLHTLKQIVAGRKPD